MFSMTLHEKPVVLRQGVGQSSLGFLRLSSAFFVFIGLTVMRTIAEFLHHLAQPHAAIHHQVALS